MDMQRRLAGPGLFLAACLAAAGLPAQAFNVAENPNNALDTFPNRPGDPLIVPGEPSPPTTLVVQPGVNVALGGLGSCFGFGCRDDYDAFRMLVPDGLQIDSTELLVVNSDGTAEQLWVFAGPPGGTGVLRDPPATHPDWQVGRLFALTDNLFINGLGPAVSSTVLGPGYYDVIAFNFNFVGGGVWEATFNAGAFVVPLPPAIALLAPLLLVLPARRRR